MKLANSSRKSTKTPAVKPQAAPGEPQSPSQQFDDVLALGNQNEIEELMRRYDTTKPVVVMRLLRIGRDELVRRLDIEARFESLDSVADCNDSPDTYKRRAMGFRDGKLVECTPRGDKPITLRESIRFFIWAQDQGSFSSGPDAVERWLKMILPLVPAGKAAK